MILELWAKFCARMGADFPTFNRGADLLMERESIWADRGFPALLRALEVT